MNENESAGGVKFSLGNKPTPTGTDQTDVIASPVEDNVDNQSTITAAQESEDILDSEYIDERAVTVHLVKNYSLYRKANDKVLPKKKDFIGGSVGASRTLSSNKGEIEEYFPSIIGIAPNNVEFITRVKQYLNNIRIGVDTLGVTFNTSFIYAHKKDYYLIKSQEDKIEEAYAKVNRNNLAELKVALRHKIETLNILEGTKYKVGRPVNDEQYLMYRHCLLYNDVAKDVAIINSDPNIRFYFKDEQREADKARKFRTEVNKAKTNYVAALADDKLFDSVYTQYLVLHSQPVVAGLREDALIREQKLDKFSSEDPIKFNKMFTNKDVKLIGTIELLIAHGELNRSEFNQQISTNDGTFVGSNMGEALIWFKNPDNTSTINAYMNRLNNI